MNESGNGFSDKEKESGSADAAGLAAEPLDGDSRRAAATAERQYADGGAVGKGVRSLYEWVEAAVFALVLVVLIFTFICRTVGVDGESMFSTLHDRDRLLVTSYLYTPQRGDIIIINRYVQEPLVKRVIATEGDTFLIEGSTRQVILNGERLDESAYIRGETPSFDLEYDKEYTVEEGCVFVMGDNREYSKDSRDNSVGMVKTDDIIGRAFFRIFPFERAGSL